MNLASRPRVRAALSALVCAVALAAATALAASPAADFQVPVEYSQARRTA